MTGAMVRGLRVPVLAAALVAAGWGAASAQDLGSAVEESYPTNLTMLTDAAQAAVKELLVGFNAPPGATLRVESASDHEANWFVENLLLTRLTDLGYSAYLKQAPMVGPPAPPSAADSSAADSASVNGPGPKGRAGAAGPAADTGPAPDEYVFRYRVAEFGILYPESHRTSPLGSRRVQRLAAVSLYANLLKGRREDVVWVGSGDTERIDVVPAGKLPLLEGKTFPFTQPTLHTRGWGVLVEPALVTGIVAGLIYLFYTNQN